MFCRYCSELATEEKILLALVPISRTVPTTITRITANMTAYSAMSCPCTSDQSPRRPFFISSPPLNQADRQNDPPHLVQFRAQCKLYRPNSFSSKINNLRREREN